MTTTLAWGFVASVLLWGIGTLDDLLLSVFFLAFWAASALVREGVEAGRAKAFWGNVKIVSTDE